jgi:hypothetical protein
MKREQTFYVLNMAIVLMLLAPVLVTAQEMPLELATFLTDRIGLKDKELADIRRGEAVAKVLPSEKQEVAVFGIILVNASADFFCEALPRHRIVQERYVRPSSQEVQ